MNVLKTAFFLTVLTLLLIALGGALGGRGGMMIAFIFACIMNLGAYWYSDKLVLAVYRARPLLETEAPRVHGMVRNLAARAGMPVPRIYRIPMQGANAFATGRNPSNAVVGVTDGILSLLSDEELEGVLAHELSHVKHRDILISSIAATLAGAIAMLASMARWAFIFGGGRGGRGGAHPFVFLLTAILAPIAAMLVQLAVSRSREFHADEGGARLCGNPHYLASALQKLERYSGRDPVAESNPATAHLFIVNPLKGGNIAHLFSTHPPLKDRVERLMQMSR